MRCPRSALLLPLVVAAAALPGCGDGQLASRAGVTTAAPPTPDVAHEGHVTELKHDADKTAEGVTGIAVCEVLPVAQVERLAGTPGLSAAGTESLDQSTCRYGGRGNANVRVILDGAPEATRRFFDMQAEAEEFRSQGKAPPTELVEHVGDDSTYGDAGAYWTPGRERFVAFKDDRIAKLIVHLPGTSVAEERRIAIQVTKRLFAAIDAHS